MMNDYLRLKMRALWMTAATLVLTSFTLAPLANADLTYWGGGYRLGGSGTEAVSTTRSQYVTFTAQDDLAISAVRLYNTTGLTGTPTLTVELRELDENGVPTGALLGSTSFNPVGTGWQRVEFASPVAMSSGTAYGMRVLNSEGSYPWRMNSGIDGTLGGVQPHGDADPDFGRSNNNNAPSKNSMTVWVAENDLGRTYGQPYTSSVVQGVSGTPIWGNRFVFDSVAAGGTYLNSATFYMNPEGGGLSDPVTALLLSESGTVLSSAELDMSSLEAGAQFITFNFNGNYQLIADQAYYIAIDAPSETDKTLRWYGWATTDEEIYRSATFQGEEGYAVSWGTGDPTDDPTIYLNRDMHFELGFSAIPEPSTYAMAFAVASLLLVFVRRRRGVGWPRADLCE